MLGNFHWSPGTEDPADGSTEVRSDMGPLLRILGSGIWFVKALEGRIFDGGDMDMRNSVIRIPACASHGPVLVLLSIFCLTLFCCFGHSAELCSIPFRPLPTRVMSDARNWDQFEDWARQLLEAIKGVGTADSWPDLLGNVAIDSGVRPRALPSPILENPKVYSDFCMRMLDFAVFPHLSRRSQAAAAGVGGKKKARDWIQEQIREGVRNP